jgi:hypothetical protein
MKKFLLILTAFIFSWSVVAQVNITFELNMETVADVDPSGVYIAGGSGFGFPGDNLMTDPDGDGIYSITIQKDAGFSSHYAFLNGNCGDWSCKENLFGLPCGDPDNYNDRFLPAVTQDTTIQACFGTCDFDGGCTIVTDSVFITIELNTELIDVIDPSGIYIAGGSGFGFPGDNPLLDLDGDGIYTGVFKRPAGFTSHYTFLNGNCGDWSCKENIAGKPCADPSNYNDRLMPPVNSDTTIKACFGTCDSDGSCSVVLDSIDITFHLNATEIDIDPSGIFIAGGGNFGTPGDNPMIDPDGDGIYTFVSRRPVGFASHYTFLNGNCPDWSCKEDLSGLECGDPDSYNDRYLPATDSDITIQACFGNCVSDGSCQEETNVNELAKMNPLFTVRPSVAQDFVTIEFSNILNNKDKEVLVLNSVGAVILNFDIAHSKEYTINTESLSNGLYFIQVGSEGKVSSKKFIIQK